MRTTAIDFSIILSTRNRASILDSTIESFSRLRRRNLSVEFLIVDNGSTDETTAVLRRWESTIPLRHWRVETPGKNICLNQAVQHSTGAHLVFTDDDIIADPAWLTSYHQAIQDFPAAVIFGGKITPKFPNNTPSHIRALSTRYPALFSHYDPSPTTTRVEQPPMGPNLMIRREVFESYLYDETIGPAGSNYAMGSETELLLRLQRNEGYAFYYVPDAHVWHVVRPDQIHSDWLLGRAFRSGRGMARAITTKRWQIGGIPWTIWARLFHAKIARILTRREGNNFDAIWRLEKLRGCAYEFSENSKSQRESR